MKLLNPAFEYKFYDEPAHFASLVLEKVKGFTFKAKAFYGHYSRFIDGFEMPLPFYEIEDNDSETVWFSVNGQKYLATKYPSSDWIFFSFGDGVHAVFSLLTENNYITIIFFTGIHPLRLIAFLMFEEDQDKINGFIEEFSYGYDYQVTVRQVYDELIHTDAENPMYDLVSIEHDVEKIVKRKSLRK